MVMKFSAFVKYTTDLILVSHQNEADCIVPHIVFNSQSNRIACANVLSVRNKIAHVA